MKRVALFTAMAAVLALTTAAVAAAGLTGKYKTTISGFPKSSGINGGWVLGFATGHYKVFHNGKAFGHGSDSVSGNKITLKTGTNCKGPGTYSFKLNGNTLKFTRISDSCFGRKTVLANTFTKM